MGAPWTWKYRYGDVEGICGITRQRLLNDIKAGDLDMDDLQSIFLYCMRYSENFRRIAVAELVRQTQMRRRKRPRKS